MRYSGIPTTIYKTKDLISLLLGLDILYLYIGK